MFPVVRLESLLGRNVSALFITVCWDLAQSLAYMVGTS